MNVHVFDTPDALGAFAAQRIMRAIGARPDAVIGLATGSSPLSTYQAWAALAAAQGTDLSGVRGFALDEYAGLDPAHPESYTSVINATVTVPVGLNPAQVRVPSGVAEPAAEAADFEAAIRAAGGVDVQLLGLGRNGHLGFNEPGSAFDSRTRTVPLTDSTVRDNARFFDGDETQVPTLSITQGIGTILEARELVVVVIGEAKAAAAAASIEGPQSSEVPGSALRNHPNVLWLLDEAAASQLQGRPVTLAG